jgi:acyl-CoA reductase-like NAD-dependent aldehyde dehydrogenase
MFAAPTVLTDVSTHTAIDNEEVFGPVVVIHSFETEAYAVALANQGRYGLAAGIWTNGVHRSFRVARAVRAGGHDLGQRVSRAELRRALRRDGRQRNRARERTRRPS